MINKTDITMHPLCEYLTEYKELNSENKYRPVAVGRYGIRTRESIYSKELANDYSKNRVIFKGTLTVGMGSVQMDIGILSDNSIYSVSPAYHTYRISGIDYDYLRYCLQCRNTDMFVRFMKRGSRQGKSIDLSRWITYSIPVYPPTVQREIVERLDKVQKIIVLLQKQIQHLDNLIKARFVEMFGRPEDNKYPSVRLGDYAKLQGGFAFKSKDFVEEGIPLVQIGNVNKDYLDWDVVNAVPEEYLDKYRDFALMKDDLVMAMTRPIIKSLDSVKIAKVVETDLPCLLNQRVGRFQVKDRLHTTFLETLCKTDDFKDYVERMSGNSLQPNISSKQVEDYIIILPPEALQEQFAEFVRQVDKSKFAVQKALDEAQLLFDSLMHKYFG